MKKYLPVKTLCMMLVAIIIMLAPTTPVYGEEPEDCYCPVVIAPLEDWPPEGGVDP